MRDDFLHLGDDGKIYRIIGPGAAMVADESDEDVIRFKKALQRGEALRRAEEASRQEALRQIQQAESQKGKSDPPSWMNV